MDNDNISNSSIHSSAYQDAQGHWYSQLSSSVPSFLTTTPTTTTTTTNATMTTSSSMPLLTTKDQEHCQEEEIIPIQFEAICVSSGDDDDSRNEEKHQEKMTSILSQTTTMATMSSMQLSMITDQEHGEQGIAPIQPQTICISSDDNDDSHGNKVKHQEEMTTSILSQEWLPPAASTPLSPADSVTNNVRSERELENDLFHNIEQLVREFVNRPNCRYPYYRVMRWITGDEPKIEHIVTVVINRPTIIL